VVVGIPCDSLSVGGGKVAGRRGGWREAGLASNSDAMLCTVKFRGNGRLGGV
jgi:hypothetical protein